MPENDHPDTPAVNGNARKSPSLNLQTFMGCRSTGEFLADDVDVVISGVPFDLKTTGRPGTRFGPASIRQASATLALEFLYVLAANRKIASMYRSGVRSNICDR